MSMFKTIDAIDDMDYDSYPIDIAKFASTIFWFQPADNTIINYQDRFCFI